MWDEPFDIDMLDNHEKIIVNCPSEELEREFANILMDFGIKYPSRIHAVDRKNVWERYGKDFCYFIEGKIVCRGLKDYVRDAMERYGQYVKCTFYGLGSDIEISECDFDAIISARE